MQAVVQTIGLLFSQYYKFPVSAIALNWPGTKRTSMAHNTDINRLTVGLNFPPHEGYYSLLSTSEPTLPSSQLY